MKKLTPLLSLATMALLAPLASAEPAQLVKEKDVVIYSDDQFHSAFPSVVRRPDGELILAFRRAPDRRIFGEKGTSHTDPNSYLVQVRSKDNGETWTKNPALIPAGRAGPARGERRGAAGVARRRRLAFGHVPPGFIPVSARPQFVVDLALPQGTDIRTTAAVSPRPRRR